MSYTLRFCPLAGSSPRSITSRSASDDDEPTPSPVQPSAAAMPRLLTLRDVTAATALSRSAVYALMAESRFPNPIRIGARAVLWVEQEVSRLHRQPSPGRLGAAPAQPGLNCGPPRQQHEQPAVSTSDRAAARRELERRRQRRAALHRSRYGGSDRSDPRPPVARVALAPGGRVERFAWHQRWELGDDALVVR